MAKQTFTRNTIIEALKKIKSDGRKISYRSLQDELHIKHNVVATKSLLDEFKIDIYNERAWDGYAHQTKSDGTSTYKSLSWLGDSVKTLPEIRNFFDVDDRIWDMERVLVNGWDVTAKINNEMVKGQNNQVKVWFRKKIPAPIVDAIDSFLKKANGHRPRYKYPKRKVPDDPHILVMSMPDAHIGMMAWKNETGNNYNTNIACKL